MKAKKVLKIIGIILVILIVLVLIHTIRNFIIVRSLQKNFEQYSSSQNYHVISHSVQGETTTDINYYKKDKKEVMIINRTNNGKTLKMSVYNNGNRIDTFYDTNEKKVAKLNSKTTTNMSISNGLETESNLQTFLVSIVTFIKKTEINQKECYEIKNFKSASNLSGEDNNYLYIEKDTGLMVKNVLNDQVMERKYEFENVDDSIFVEPDISEYTLQ